MKAPGRLRAFVIEEHLSPLLADPVRVPVPAVGGDQRVRAHVRRPPDPSRGLPARPAVRGVDRPVRSGAAPAAAHRAGRRHRASVDRAIFDRPLTRMWEDPPFRPPVSKPWPQGFEFYGMRDYVAGTTRGASSGRAAARTGRTSSASRSRASPTGSPWSSTTSAGAQPRPSVGDLRARGPRSRVARRLQHQAGLLGPARQQRRRARSRAAWRQGANPAARPARDAAADRRTGARRGGADASPNGAATRTCVSSRRTSTTARRRACGC